MKISNEVWRILFNTIQEYNDEISDIGHMSFNPKHGYQMFYFTCYETDILDDNDILQYIEDISKISKIIHILTSLKLSHPIEQRYRYLSEYTEDEKVRFKTCQQELCNLFIEGNTRGIRAYILDLTTEFPTYLD